MTTEEKPTHVFHIAKNAVRVKAVVWDIFSIPFYNCAFIILPLSFNDRHIIALS
jgi:hypothetical protein